MEELDKLEEPQKPVDPEDPREPEVLREVLVKPMKRFVLTPEHPVDSEVDGSERRAAARVSERPVQHKSPFSPFWHSVLLSIPC